MSDTDPNINRLLSERYRLVDLLGQGSMGKVYRGEDTVLGNVTVAVKFLSQTLLNEKMRQRFEREATICAHLSEKSIHIVRVKDYGVDQDNIPFFVMEHLQGNDLSSIIDQSPLSLPRFFRLIRQICLGMKAAHQGIFFNDEQYSIIHRDIKPSNILIVDDPSLGELVKILDFGIAKLAQTGVPQTHSFMGTLAYCSPEQMEGKELHVRSDIYSLGIMMYEMLAGDMPIMPKRNTFGAWYSAHCKAEPIPFDPELGIPEALEELIMQCIAKHPLQRPSSVEEIGWSMNYLSEKDKQNSVQATLTPAEANNQLINIINNEDATLNEDNNQLINIVNEDATLDEDNNQQINIVNEEDTEDTDLQSVGREHYSFTNSTNAQFKKDASTLSNIPVDIICMNEQWPANKPQLKIVFPQIIAKEEYTIPTIWGMLDGEEIANRLSSICYNQFLFIKKPHPMLLWITAIYNESMGARWFPCYLDLKTPESQKMARLLAENREYYILLFALGAPEKYRRIIKVKIAKKQCDQLLQWSNQSEKLRENNPIKSKKTLQKEYERLKEDILMKLKAAIINDTLIE